MSSTARKIHSVEELREIVAPVAEKYGVDKVYLFGSIARGDFNEDSGYDFFIEKGKDTKRDYPVGVLFGPSRCGLV